MTSVMWVDPNGYRHEATNPALESNEFTSDERLPSCLGVDLRRNINRSSVAIVSIAATSSDLR